jgi:hypothetical protein
MFEDLGPGTLRSLDFMRLKYVSLPVSQLARSRRWPAQGPDRLTKEPVGAEYSIEALFACPTDPTGPSGA